MCLFLGVCLNAVVSVDDCEEVQLLNATAVCCRMNTFRVEDFVSFCHYEATSVLLEILKLWIFQRSKFGDDVRVGCGRHSTDAVKNIIDLDVK